MKTLHERSWIVVTNLYLMLYWQSSVDDHGFLFVAEMIFIRSENQFRDSAEFLPLWNLPLWI